MGIFSIQDAVSRIRERLFHVGEKKRLSTMKAHARDRDRSAHADFLSRRHDTPELVSHQHNIERQGSEFWNYYFEDESPTLAEPGAAGSSDSMDEHLKFWQKDVTPEMAQLKPVLQKDDELVMRRWARSMKEAERSLQAGDLEEAEHQFRLALADAEEFGQPDRKRAISLSGLARTLEQLGRSEEADELYQQALSLEENLLVWGDGSIEDEFFTIARHFVDEGHYHEVEAVYDDLLQRLKTALGRHDVLIARCLNELGVIYSREESWEHAEQLFERALSILEGLDPRPEKQLAAALNNYAALLESTGRHEMAEEFYMRALSRLQGDAPHPDTAA